MKELEVEHYRGPAVHPSAWSLWELTEGISTQSRIRYMIFRHRRIGTVVEIAEGSTGDFRYSSNDFETPWIVTKCGIRKSVSSFGAPGLVDGLRDRSILGRRLGQPIEQFGSWIIEVMSSNIAITNSLSVCTLPFMFIPGLIGKANADNVQLRVILTVDSLMFVGDAVSINIPPVAFRISHGVSEAVDIPWEEACKFVKPANYQGIFEFSVEEIQANKGRTQAELEGILKARRGKNDSLGEIRRTMAKSTKFKREEDTCAEEFLKLPVLTRIKAIDSVELETLANIRSHGMISLEEYLRRSDAIKLYNAFPSCPLRAKDALEKSMYIDAESKNHIPSHSFLGWTELTWSERMAAVRTLQRREARREGDPQSPTAPRLDMSNAFDDEEDSEVKSEQSQRRRPVDPDLPPDKTRSRHYQDLMQGELSGGFRKCSTVQLDKERTEKRRIRLGKEIAQIWEECDYCGRPCLVPGEGFCPRCREFERDKAILGINQDTRRPDTYLGDPRALLGHPGFDEYIPAPPPEEQLYRRKIDVTLASTTADGRRQMLDGLAGVEPAQDIPTESPGKTRPRSSKVQFEEVPPEQPNADGEVAPPPQIPLDKLHALIKTNRFDDVKSLLLRYRNQPVPPLPSQGADADEEAAAAAAAADRVVDLRDEHGNTPLIAAVQQGRRRLTKLLLAAEATLDAQNKEGNTALHYAAMYGYAEIFDYLKARGADDTVTNVAGLICYQMVGRSAAKDHGGGGGKKLSRQAKR